MIRPQGPEENILSPVERQKESIRRAAGELGYAVLVTRIKYGDSLLLVGKDLGPSVKEALVITFSAKRNGQVTVRALEECCSHYLKSIAKIESITNLSLTYFLLDQAINARGKGGVVGGWFAWWQLCTKESLRDAKEILGDFPREKPVKRNRKVLADKLTVLPHSPPEARLVPQRHKITGLGNFPRLRP